MPSIGERIKHARLSLGLNLRQLAKLAEPLSATAISRYENDQDIPGSDVLLRLSHALDVKVEYFFRPISVEIACPQYRKHSRLPIKKQRTLEHKIIDTLERYLTVESLFGPQRFQSFVKPSASEIPVNEIADAEEVAKQLRIDWQLGNAPIENLCETLEDHGVKVLLVEPEDKFDGFSCWANNEIPAVVASKNCPRARQRLTLAHELGHLLLNINENVDVEKAVFRFAAAFLVPRDAVKMELGDNRGRLSELELSMLKKKWGLSMGAWIYRLHDLGVLGDAAYRRIQMQFRKNGWNRNEPGDEEAGTEESLRMQRLIEQAVVEDIISVSKAATLLGEDLIVTRQKLGAGRGVEVL